MKTKYVLTFPHNAVQEPITYSLVETYHIKLNILRAQIDEKGGKMVLEMMGPGETIKKGIEYLKSKGVIVQSIEEGVRKNEEKCTHCGVCISICPVSALKADKKTSKIIFDEDKCVVCGLCIDACPTTAMELLL
ncbi:MAG: 4Fe-4S binding protein [Thermoplasmata archaeon]